MKSTAGRARGNRIKQILRALLPPSLKTDQGCPVFMKIVEVGGVADEAQADKLLDGSLAKTFDVHRSPVGEVLDPSPHLCGASGILAVIVRFLFTAIDP